MAVLAPGTGCKAVKKPGAVGVAVLGPCAGGVSVPGPGGMAVLRELEKGNGNTLGISKSYPFDILAKIIESDPKFILYFKKKFWFVLLIPSSFQPKISSFVIHYRTKSMILVFDHVTHINKSTLPLLQ